MTEVCINTWTTGLPVDVGLTNGELYQDDFLDFRLYLSSDDESNSSDEFTCAKKVSSAKEAPKKRSTCCSESSSAKKLKHADEESKSSTKHHKILRRVVSNLVNCSSVREMKENLGVQNQDLDSFRKKVSKLFREVDILKPEIKMKICDERARTVKQTRCVGIQTQINLVITPDNSNYSQSFYHESNTSEVLASNKQSTEGYRRSERLLSKSEQISFPKSVRLR